VDAAIVELDALADAVRAAAEHHDLPAVGGLGLALLVVRRIHVRGLGRELGSAGVDALVDRAHALGVSLCTHLFLARAQQLGQTPIGKSLGLDKAHLQRRQLGQRTALQRLFGRDDLLDLRQEPRVDGGLVEDFLRAHADAKCVGHVQQPLRAGLADLLNDLFSISAALAQAVDAGLEAAQRLLQALLESAADRHHLAHRFHLRRQARISGRKFLECEARDLGDHVVD